MKYDESFITLKLILHDYLIFSLGNCVYETPTETGLQDFFLLGESGLRDSRERELGVRELCFHVGLLARV